MKPTLQQVIMWLRNRYDESGIDDDKIAADFIESRLDRPAKYQMSLADDRYFIMEFPKTLSPDERADIIEMLDLTKRQLLRECNGE